MILPIRAKMPIILCIIPKIPLFYNKQTSFAANKKLRPFEPEL